MGGEDQEAMEQAAAASTRCRRAAGDWAAAAADGLQSAANGVFPQFLIPGKNPYASIFGELYEN